MAEWWQAALEIVGTELSEEPIDFVAKYVVTPLTVLGAGLWQQAESRMKRKTLAFEAEQERMRKEQEELKTLVRDRALMWSEACIHTLAEVWVLLKEQSDGRAMNETTATELIGRLSALVDTGRLFFPNHSGQLDWPSWAERPPAMKGFRDPILDCLMLAHEELGRARFRKDLTGDVGPANNVFGARRAYVSQLQAWLDPHSLGLGEATDDMAGAMAKGKQAADPWELLRPLVADFERRYPLTDAEKEADLQAHAKDVIAGKKHPRQPRQGRFWGEPPMPRTELMAAMKRAG